MVNRLPPMKLTRNHVTDTMPRAKSNRKALFRASLVLAGMTAEQWAKQEGVTPGHLSQVLSEKRESRSLTEKIDAFVEKHRRRLAA